MPSAYPETGQLPGPRLHLESCVLFWAPQFKKDIDKLERVQNSKSAHKLKKWGRVFILEKSQHIPPILCDFSVLICLHSGACPEEGDQNAAPNYMGDDVPVTEVPVARRWAPCLQDENPEPQEGHLAVPTFSACMLRCTAQAMLGIVSTKSSTSLKLNEGREGDDHEFCWMLHLRCQKGERLTKAFLLLNLEQPPDGSQPPPYRLLLTAPPSLRRHVRVCHGSRAARLLPGDACGMCFDVTEPFRSAEGGQDAEMCVRAVCHGDDACGGLSLAFQCPPFLATLWRSVPRPDG